MKHPFHLSRVCRSTREGCPTLIKRNFFILPHNNILIFFRLRLCNERLLGKQKTGTQYNPQFRHSSNNSDFFQTPPVRIDESYKNPIVFINFALQNFRNINFQIMSQNRPISSFIEKHYLHFNAAALVDAAKGYKKHIAEGKKMMVTLAGAMSTGELGISFAEMIRQDKVQIISCTGANLEEDIMNLVAHSHYRRIPNYRDLTPEQEWDLLQNHLNRVTDTCIPEEEAFRKLQSHLFKVWKDAEDKGERLFPHEFMFRMLNSGELKQHFEIDPNNSWMVAAAERNVPMVVPGWEDSTMGNIFASYCLTGELKASTMKSGIEYMVWLADWYTENAGEHGIGFFQIGGGIAGDFPICVVPMLHQDLERDGVPFWSYFCQISDSTTSYGSYSGAVPNEKITWGKLSIDTPKYIIESDATIVAPLIFAYILDM